MNSTSTHRPRIIYPGITSLHLSDAFLCVNCDTIHDQKECPSCTCRFSLSLWKVLNSEGQRRLQQRAAGEPAVKLVVDEPARNTDAQAAFTAHVA